MSDERPGDSRHVLTGSVSVANPRQTRRKWGIIALLSTPLLGAACLGGPMVTLLVPAIAMLVAAVAGLATADQDPGTGHELAGEISIDSAGVAVEAPDGLLLASFARDDLVDGWIEANAWNDEHNLVLVMRDGSEARVARDTSFEATETLLASLGLDHRAVRMALVADPRGVRGCMGVFLGFMLVLGVLPMVVAAGAAAAGQPELVHLIWMSVVFLAPVLAMPHFLMPNRLLIGHDGVLVQRLFRRRRFFSFDRLAVKHDPAMLWIGDLRPSLGVRASEGASATAARVIRERKTRYDAEGARDVQAILDRGERSLDDYRSMLEQLLEPGQASFRRLVVHAEDLLRIVEDPKATPTQRAGAAYALARRPEAAAPERLRIAVEAVAQPALRVALEQASEGALEAEALAEAEAAVARARVREG